jgi:hypothetical protein
MIKRLLTEEPFRQRAVQLQRAMAATGGARRAAEIAEQALTTGRPVSRNSMDRPQEKKCLTR